MQSIVRFLLSVGFLFFVASCSRVEPISQVPAIDAQAATGASSHSHDQHDTAHSDHQHGTSQVDHHRDQPASVEHNASKPNHVRHGEKPAAHHQSGRQQLAATQHTADEPAPSQHSSPPNKDEPALAIFDKRILPIFQSAKASSCSECHLSGVDLKDYIRPTQQETFASLVSAEMIDVEKPDNSKILRFISRRPEQPSLVTEKVRDQEFEAFRAWIRAAVNDPSLLAEKGRSEPVGPQLPDEVIRHARKDRVLASFIDNIWAEVGRCAACHSPDRNQKQVKEHGEQVSWIKLRDPQATLNYMLEAGLIDADEPEKSLLLMKPTMQVKHGGGQKMVVGDRTYKQFRRFIDDYAVVVAGKYTKAEQLPEPNDEVSVVTEIWLKIEDVPETFDKMLLQADLHRWTDSGWSQFRVATSDRPVFGKGKLWQHSLSLTAPRGTDWAKKIRSESLPPGKYLLKLYIDRTDKLQKDFSSDLGEEDFVGEVEIESRWPAGYGKMTVVKFPAK